MLHGPLLSLLPFVASDLREAAWRESAGQAKCWVFAFSYVKVFGEVGK